MKNAITMKNSANDEARTSSERPENLSPWTTCSIAWPNPPRPLRPGRKYGEIPAYRWRRRIMTMAAASSRHHTIRILATPSGLAASARNSPPTTVPNWAPAKISGDRRLSSWVSKFWLM